MAYRDSVLAIPNLRSYWRLGETTGGSAIDELGHVTASYLEAPIKGVPGSVVGDTDRAVDFNRAGYLRALLPDWPTNWTVGVVAKIHGYLNVTTDSLITTQGGKFGLRETTGGSLVMTVGSATLAAVPGETVVPAPETWFHAVMTFDSAGGPGALYINGVQVKQGNGAVFTAPSTLYFGIGAAGSEWNGVADELFYADRKLSAAEILSLYNSWRGGNPVTAASVTLDSDSDMAGNGGVLMLGASVALDGASDSAGAGSVAFRAAAALDGASDSSGSGSVIVAGGAASSADSEMDDLGTLILRGLSGMSAGTDFKGAGAVQLSLFGAHDSTSDMTGCGSLTFTLSGTQTGDSDASGAGTLITTGGGDLAADSDMTGAGGPVLRGRHLEAHTGRVIDVTRGARTGPVRAGKATTTTRGVR